MTVPDPPAAVMAYHGPSSTGLTLRTEQLEQRNEYISCKAMHKSRLIISLWVAFKVGEPSNLYLDSSHLASICVEYSLIKSIYTFFIFQTAQSKG